MLAAIEAAPRQFAIVARHVGNQPVVVAWGQDFGDGTVLRLSLPGNACRRVFEHSSPDVALEALRLLNRYELSLVWTAPTAEGF